MYLNKAVISSLRQWDIGLVTCLKAWLLLAWSVQERSWSWHQLNVLVMSIHFQWTPPASKFGPGLRYRCSFQPYESSSPFQVNKSGLFVNHQILLLFVINFSPFVCTMLSSQPPKTTINQRCIVSLWQRMVENCLPTSQKLSVQIPPRCCTKIKMLKLQPISYCKCN